MIRNLLDSRYDPWADPECRQEASMRVELILRFTTEESRTKIWSVKLIVAPSVNCCLFKGGCSGVVYSLLIVAPIVCGILCLSLFCYEYFVPFLVLQSSQ